MREDLTGDERRQRIRRQRDLLQRAVGVIPGEEPRQRQQRGEQGGDPQHAGAHRRQQRPFGSRREREQRNHDHVEQQLHAEFRARAQRDLEVARERPAHAGQHGARIAADAEAGSARAMFRPASSSARASRAGRAEHASRPPAIPPRSRCSATRLGEHRDARPHRAPSPARPGSTAGGEQRSSGRGRCAAAGLATARAREACVSARAQRASSAPRIDSRSGPFAGQRSPARRDSPRR